MTSHGQTNNLSTLITITAMYKSNGSPIKQQIRGYITIQTWSFCTQSHSVLPPSSVVNPTMQLAADNWAPRTMDMFTDTHQHVCYCFDRCVFVDRRNQWADKRPRPYYTLSAEGLQLKIDGTAQSQQ